MEESFEYTTHEEIMARLTALFKEKQFNPADVMNWAIECETEWLNDTCYTKSFLKVKVPVVKTYARIPINCVRLLEVYENPENIGGRVKGYINENGAYYIVGDQYKKDHVYMNYEGIPVDKNGIPLIKKGHEEACVAHVIVKSHYEDFKLGRISPTVYGEMKEERNLQCAAAVQSWSSYSREDINNITAVKMNMLPRLHYYNHEHQR